jgi:uncharacterized membrane protein YdfJ with MMPL/SSD domain
MFLWLGRLAARRRRVLLACAGLLAVAAAFWGSGVFAVMGTGGYGHPGSEAVRATELLDRELGHGGTDAVAVYRDPDRTVDDPGFAVAITDMLAALPPGRVAAATSLWTPGLPADVPATLVSTDRHATYVALTMHGATEDERLTNYTAIVDHLHVQGLETALGGGMASLHQLQGMATADLTRAELVAMPVLFVLLVVVFGGAVAAALPIVLGLLAIVGAMVLMRLLAGVTDMSIFAFNIATILGLGLAIDYGLFVVTRFRAELAARRDTTAALLATMTSAGRTVWYSGVTVCVAFSGLLLFPQPMIRSVGLGGISAVVVDLLVALTVLPALLAVLGPRVDALSVPWLRRRTGDGGAWRRFAATVMRRPVVWLVAAGSVLLMLAAPALSLQAGLTNHRYLPSEAEGQTSLARIAAEFPAGGPGTTSGHGLDVAVVGSVDRPELDGYVQRLATLEAAAGARVSRGEQGLAHVTVGFTGDPDEERNVRLVHDLRAEPWPRGATDVLVGGAGGPAEHVDNLDAVLAVVPWAMLVVVVAILVLLFLAFGSVLLPVKAVLVTALSLGASAGAIVWGIQEGGLGPLLGFSAPGTTDVGTLVLVLVIVFGLATDYELFLLSSVREEYLATGRNGHAVAVGLQRSGQVITSAALLLVVVFATMGATAGSLVLTTIGVGLTVAIVVDATLVRAVLVPATMRLLGRANWWLPGPLRRLHTRLDLHATPDLDNPRRRVDASSRA